jgi:hypothetical protein
MNDKGLDNEHRFATWKNEATRQRWELFHTAIALAKQSNAEAMEEAETIRQRGSSETSDTVRRRAEPLLSIAR